MFISENEKRTKRVDQDLKQSLQEKLISLRGEKSNVEFADYLGITCSALGTYVNGKRLPDMTTLRIIAEKCHVSTDWLLGIDKDMYFNLDPETVFQVEKYSKVNHEYESDEDSKTPLDILNEFLSDRNFWIAVHVLSDITYSEYHDKHKEIFDDFGDLWEIDENAIDYAETMAISCLHRTVNKILDNTK